MWRHVSSILRHLLSTGLSIFVVGLSGFASILTRAALRGRDYSDVGVPMYENNGIATSAGVLVFLIVLLGFLYILQRTLSRDLQWLPYLVAMITCIFSYQSLYLMLLW